MKKITTFIGLPLLTLFFILWSGLSIGQTIVTLQPDQAPLTAGTILVPVYVTSTFQSCNIYLTFDKTVMTPASPWYSDVDGHFAVYGENSNYNTTGNIQTAFLDIETGPPFHNYSLTGSSLITLRFTFISGTTTLHIKTSPNAAPVTKFWDEVGSQVTPYTYTDAIMSDTYITITSVTAGGPWATSASWDLGHTPSSANNVIINSTTNPVTVDAPITSAPHTVTVNTGAKLTANASFSFGGTFTINDGGSFIDNNSLLLSATVKRTMTGNWTSGSPGTGTIWHGISSPVSSQSNSIFNGSLMNKWNEGTQNWDPLTLPYETMPVGKGYIVAPTSGGITPSFVGTLNTGPQTISGLTKTGSTTWSGFNLVGNPFSSAIQWNTNISVSNVANYAWVWNSSAYIALDRTIGTGVIAAEQGFFVQATGSGSVTIPNTNRTHGTSTFYKSGVSDLLTLKVEGNGYWDQTQVRIHPGSSEIYNIDYDALKFTGSDIAPQLYTYKQDVNLSILSLPSLNVYPIIMIGFKPGAAGSFTITASDIETFTPGTDLYLEDLVTGTDQDLKVNPVYEFSAISGQPDHRFNLHFAALGVPTTNGNNIHIYSSDKNIYVNIPYAINGNIVVYNIMGVEVTRKAIMGNSLNKLATDLCTGYYIVKVLGDSQSMANKVFIR